MSFKPKHIMVLAGEPSGDLHGANLLKELKKKEPSVNITGIGGDGMKACGMELFFHIDQLSVMGVTEVLFQFNIIKKAFDLFKAKIRTTSPDLLILIDYPGFNLRAAAFAKKNNIPVLYYITPKIWAWKKSRIKKIKLYVDHVALIFPFEEKLYLKEHIPCTFVGHPLLDFYTDQMVEKKEKRENSSLVVGLLPGSRESEISNLLETMLQAAIIIAEKQNNVKFLVSQALSVNQEHFKAVLHRYNHDNHDNLFTIVKGDVARIFKKADFLVAASGTVTLEAAICRIPMVIVYKMSFVSYSLAKIFVKLNHVGLANIIAGKEVIPELIQNSATPEKIADKTLSILKDKNLSSMAGRLSMIRNLLGGKGASKRTAKIAHDMIWKKL